MIGVTGRRCGFVVGTICLFVVCQLAWGSPSGLNNIPTTDVVPEKKLVLQTWLNLAENMHPQQYVGFKAGPLKGVEFGVDWKANDNVHGHATLQAKYGFDIKKDLLRGVIGIADLSDDCEHNGYYFPYAATSLDIDIFRLHFGYAPQPHNERFFAGIDKTFPFLNRNLQLKGDAIHINDREDVLFSAGFLYELAPLDNGGGAAPEGLLGVLDKFLRNIILEGWVSMPSTGDQEVFTLKVNYVISF